MTHSNVLCCVLSCVEGCHQTAEKQAYEVTKMTTCTFFK